MRAFGGDSPSMRRRWVALALVALIAGCGGGGHDKPQAGLIVPHHSIDRLELGMTEAGSVPSSVR